MNEKLKTFWNFSKKSGTAIVGTDNLLKTKKLFLIAISDDLAENSKKKVLELATEKNVKIFNISSKNFEDIVENTRIKAIGFSEKNLAKAFEEHAKNNGGTLI